MDTPTAGTEPRQTPGTTAPSSRHWLDDPAHVRLLWRGFLVVLALMVLAELAVHLHPHFGIDSLFGFHAWYGFGTCALMILVAKALALVLKRPDTYYDDPVVPSSAPASTGRAQESGHG